MGTVAIAPALPNSPSHCQSDLVSTIPDPRSSVQTSPDLARASSLKPFHNPELSSEVATLSNKLINAINHQTSLDDTLAATRHELDSSIARTRQLEVTNKNYESLIANGVLVKKNVIETEMTRLIADLAEERKLRTLAEKARKEIELELENLTTALFEEANQMVSAARKEREPLQRKNEQLKTQLNDTELLLTSHQEQLADLKNVMQQMNSDRDEIDSNTNVSTSPSTPPGTQDHLTKIFEVLHLSPSNARTDSIPPAHPTSFSHLLQPVLRTDLQAVEDFNSLLRMSHSSKPQSRVSSGSYGSLNAIGLPNLATSAPAQPLVHMPSNGSTSSTSTSGTHSSSATTPSTPASNASSVSFQDVPQSLTPLKETRFYKRAVVEDIEPTLRLDVAPGLSWLARRAVLNSMSEGSLVVEPAAPTLRPHHLACSLCGENRKGEQYARSHRFRTSESEHAQLYPLCGHCLGRVRAVCDFLGFLRVIKDGHWRIDGEEGERGAWEESVRLRERMFWARIGGGVIPAFLQAKDSPRSSIAEDRKAFLERQRLGLLTIAEMEAVNRPAEAQRKDASATIPTPTSCGSTVIFTERDTRGGEVVTNSIEQPDSIVGNHNEELASSKDRMEINSQDHRDNVSTKDNFEKKTGGTATRSSTSRRNSRTMSVSIPGAFE